MIPQEVNLVNENDIPNDERRLWLELFWTPFLPDDDVNLTQAHIYNATILNEALEIWYQLFYGVYGDYSNYILNFSHTMNRNPIADRLRYEQPNIIIRSYYHPDIPVTLYIISGKNLAFYCFCDSYAMYFWFVEEDTNDLASLASAHIVYCMLDSSSVKSYRQSLYHRLNNVIEHSTPFTDDEKTKTVDKIKEVVAEEIWEKIQQHPRFIKKQQYLASLDIHTRINLISMN